MIRSTTSQPFKVKVAQQVVEHLNKQENATANQGSGHVRAQAASSTSANVKDAPRYGFVTPEIRADFEKIAVSKNLQNLRDTLIKLLPYGTISGVHGARADMNYDSVKKSWFQLDLVQAGDKAPLDFNVKSKDYDSVEGKPGSGSYRDLDGSDINWIRKLVVQPDSIRILVQRDAEGRFYDRGHSFQELTLKLAADGRVAALEGRTGRLLAFKPFWKTREVVIPPGATVTGWVTLGDRPFPTTKL